jgi:hypothetical protein
MRGIRTLPAGPDPRHPIAYIDAPDWPGYKVGSDRSVWSNWSLDGAAPGGWVNIRPVTRNSRLPEVPLLRAPGPRRFWVEFNALVDRVYPPRPAVPDDVPFVPLPEVDPRGRAKLDEDKVVELRRLKAEGWTYPQLARHFGIARSTVHYALNGCTWRHVPRADQPPKPTPPRKEVPPSPYPRKRPRAVSNTKREARRRETRQRRAALPALPTEGGVIFRTIPDCPGYALGSDRSVWYLTPRGWRPKSLHRQVGTRRRTVTLYRDKRYTSRTVASLMREVFPELPGPEADHDRAPPARRVPLDEDEVCRLKCEGWLVRELAARYGVPHGTITSITRDLTGRDATATPAEG